MLLQAKCKFYESDSIKLLAYYTMVLSFKMLCKFGLYKITINLLRCRLAKVNPIKPIWDCSVLKPVKYHMYLSAISCLLVPIAVKS